MTTPDCLAYPKGFKDGRSGTPILSRQFSREAREEYMRGYVDGRDYAAAHPKPERKRKEASMSGRGQAPFKAVKVPRGPSFTVSVTHAIMDHARIRDSSHCMIAMAIRDVRPDLKSISVDIQTIRFSDPAKGYRYSYLTPRIVQEAIINFDDGVMPEPFEFKLMGAHVTLMTVHPKVQTPRSSGPMLASGGVDSTRPRRVGGPLPPRSSLARRREFGLKALKR